MSTNRYQGTAPYRAYRAVMGRLGNAGEVVLTVASCLFVAPVVGALVVAILLLP